MDVQTQAVMQMGNYVAGILNRQLVPAVIRKNYGHLEGLPLPELRCSVPDAGVNMDRLDFYCKFVNELGGRVAWSTIYDQCGVPMPGPDDDVAGPSAQPGTADPLSAAAAARYGTSAMQRAERRAQAAERAAEPVAAAFMHPVLQSLADAVKTGAGPEQMKRILDNSATNADVLADALVEVTRSALGVGRGEAVSAAKKKCNQFAHVPGCENGDSSKDGEERKPKRHPKDWKHINPAGRTTENKARLRLKNGFDVKTPAGDVRLDSCTLEHWEKANKTGEDISNRLRNLPLLEALLKHPAEIWEDSNGDHTYLGCYLKENKKYMVSFTIAKDGVRTIKTFWPESNAIDSKRQGKLIYEQGD